MTLASRTHRRLFIERLESRCMLAGNVTATVTAGGDLIVRGDGEANRISISDVGSGKFIVSGSARDGAPTMVNGSDSSFQTSGITGGLDIRLQSGDDYLVVQSARVLDDLWTDFGGGADSVFLKGVEVLGDLRIETAGGKDYVRIYKGPFEFGVLVHGETRIITDLYSSAGENDQVLIDESEFVGKFTASLLGGGDTMYLRNSAVRYELDIHMGAGTDRLQILDVDLEPKSVFTRRTLHGGGGGKDFARVEQATDGGIDLFEFRGFETIVRPDPS